MSDYIEREALRKDLAGEGAACFMHGKIDETCGLITALDITKKAPAVDVEPVRHAKWVIQLEHDGRSKFLRCTNYRTPYCPNCGARMDGAN